MPTKILTAQPAEVYETLQGTLGTVPTDIEAPYFSVPDSPGADGTVDPDDPDRQLLPGEIYLATAMLLANTTASTATVTLSLISEAGATAMILPALDIPAHDTYPLRPGYSVFKRNLANPAAAGGRFRMTCSPDGAVDFVVSVFERQAQTHAPDIEV